MTQAEIDAGGGDRIWTNTVTADSAESAPDTDTLNIPIDAVAGDRCGEVVDDGVGDGGGPGGAVHVHGDEHRQRDADGVTVTDPNCDAAPVLSADG